MSPLRLTATATGMAAVAVVLAALTPSRPVLVAAGTAPQRLADTAGPDVVVLCAAALLAWTCWAWGALGLLLTAAGALPGPLGAAARAVLRAVLPAGARRVAAVALGIGLGIGGPGAGVALAAPPPAAGSVAVPDWPLQAGPPVTGSSAPSSTSAPVPDWPAAPEGVVHVVAPGDSLWRIAAGSLRSSGRQASAAEVTAAVDAWWSANRGVVGPDPDLLRPGQVLHAPEETR
jgi:LysM domain